MSEKKSCIVCGRNELETPVTKFYYQEGAFYICSQHIPVLIHNPEDLIGLLPNAKKIKKG
ncbi:MAG: hypothetical protein ACWA42_01170 [Lutibacter sp.]